MKAPKERNKKVHFWDQIISPSPKKNHNSLRKYVYVVLIHATWCNDIYC